MILVIDCGSQKIPDISLMLSSLGREQIVVGMNEISEDVISSAKGIVISGSPMLLTKTDANIYIEKFNFLKQLSIPCLGICFGHQVLGLVFGAEVFLGKPVRETIPIEVLAPNILFKGHPQNPHFTEDHTEGITLPKDFLHLAKSSDYAVEAMKHARRNLFGVQFHPEVSGENGKILFRNFISLIPE
jgi:GMP synthase (glutamine-hydrolysing)